METACMRQLQLILIPKTVCTACHAFHINIICLFPTNYIYTLILFSFGKKWVYLDLNEIIINFGMDVPDN